MTDREKGMDALNASEQQKSVDFNKIFSEERARLEQTPEYEASSFAPGTEEVAELHRSAEARTMREYLESTLGEKATENRQIIEGVASFYSGDCHSPRSSLSIPSEDPSSLEMIKNALDNFSKQVEGSDHWDFDNITVATEGDKLVLKSESKE